MIALPNIDEIKNELSGDKMKTIINKEAIARHIQTFLVVFEYSIISCVVVSCVVVGCVVVDDIIIYIIIIL
jgi:hypothetical protein